MVIYCCYFITLLLCTKKPMNQDICSDTNNWETITNDTRTRPFQQRNNAMISTFLITIHMYAVVTKGFSSVILVLISTTFLCELECKDGTNVGLAAGLYSGKRRPDLYRTPHALQRVLGPIGPALHCGVFVISQCMHFLSACEVVFALGFSFWFWLIPPEGGRILIFFFFFRGRDSAKLPDIGALKASNRWGVCKMEDAGEIKWARGLKVAGRGRLLRARFSWLAGSVFPLEQALLLSRTEIGLEVWNWFRGESLEEEVHWLFSSVRPPLAKESSTKVDSHSSWTMSSYCTIRIETTRYRTEPNRYFGTKYQLQ